MSAYPAEVTVAMLDALEKGAATSAAMARALGVVLDVVDVGVARPTGDLRIEPAMDAERFDDAVEAGVEAVERAAAAGADLLVFGEMGIGNTTAAAAVAATLYDEPAAAWCGRGTGLDDAGLARKVEAVEACRARVRAGTGDPIEILREAGGAELAAIAGATVAARRRSIPVVLDGYVVTAAVAPLASVRADALDHVIAGHRSAEPGHGRLLERLGLAPLLDAGSAARARAPARWPPCRSCGSRRSASSRSRRSRSGAWRERARGPARGPPPAWIPRRRGVPDADPRARGDRGDRHGRLHRVVLGGRGRWSAS